MLINDIHIFVKFLKNQGQNKYHSPEQIDDAINRASLDLFRQEEKVFEETQIVTDTLRPFKVKKSDYVSGGAYSLPSDYVRATNISHLYNYSQTVSTEDESEYCDSSLNTEPTDNNIPSIEKEIDIITDSDWIKRQDNLIVGPTEANPIARIHGNSFEVLPTTVKPILYYLKEPSKAKWAYDISQDGRTPIFNEGNSTDLEWATISHNEIIEKTLGFLGIAVRDEVMMQYEQIQKRNNNEG